MTAGPDSAAPTSDAPKGFEVLWQAHPWPATPPFPGAPLSGRNSSGFELLTDAIAARGGETVIMEIGAEFGGSTRRFLSVPGTWVVSVDPWPDSYGANSFPELKQYFDTDAAMYKLFQSFCWYGRERIATVREYAPRGPVAVYDAGVPVDFVYIDGDHRYDAVMRDLTIADALFPNAVLCGDDWTLKSNHRKYEDMRVPVRRAVVSWAAFHDVHVEVSENTWMLDKSRPFNLEAPPARFVDIDATLVGLDNRVRRIESVVTTPSLTTRIERKVRSVIRR